MTDAYTVQTQTFEGPLDLLLDLIDKKKLSVNEVSLKEVADGYIKYLEKLENLPVGQTAHFLLVASTLLLLKSITLLPSLELTEEEEQSIDELERRLKDYKEIKRLSEYVQNQFGNKRIFWAHRRFVQDPIFSPDKRTNIEDLKSILSECLNTLPIKEGAPKATIEKVISLEEMINNLQKRIQNSVSTTFSAFTGIGEKGIKSKEEKINIIIGFLAILELVKQEIVHVTQEMEYSDITIKSK